MIKVQTRLQGYLNALTQLVFIMNVIDDRRLWIDEDVLNFFEVSMFNFYENADSHNILKQGYILKRNGGRANKAYW